MVWYCNANPRQEKAGQTTFLSDNIDTKEENVTSYKEGHFIKYKL